MSADLGEQELDALEAHLREGWRWYTARAARGDAAKAAADGSVAGLLREQITAGEARAEKSAERAVAIAGALDASARSALAPGTRIPTPGGRPRPTPRPPT